MQLSDYPLGQCIATPDNPRVFGPDDGKDAGLVELAESIKAVGVLEPVLGRPHPEQEGCVDVRAGERRLRAARIAGLDTVPVIIRDMTDQEALAVTVTENLQREDLHPLEEGRGIQLLLDRGWTLDQVAGELGWARKAVSRRAKLSALSEAWQAEIATDLNGELRFWRAGHYEMIARFPAAVQDELLHLFATNRAWFGDYQKPSDLRRLCADYLQALAGAPWKLDEPVGDRQACEGCEKRSDCAVQAELFDAEDFGADVKPKRRGKQTTDARCLDAGCWVAKMGAYLVRRAEDLKAKHQGAVAFVGEPHLNPLEPFAVFESIYEYQTVKKSEAGARACLVVAGPRTGQMFWGKPYAGAGGSSGGVKGQPKPLKERRAALAKSRRKLVSQKVADRLSENWNDGEDSALGAKLDGQTKLRLAVAFGLQIRRDTAGNAWELEGSKKVDAWEEFASREGVGPADLDDELFGLVVPVLRSRVLSEQTTNDYANPPSMREAEQVCGLLGLDYAAFEAAAEAEKPEPKSWAKLNADGTPKKAKPRAKAKKPARKGAKAQSGAKAEPKEDVDAEAAADTVMAWPYKDKRDRVLFIDNGFSNGADWAVYHRKPNGSLKRVVSKNLPVTRTSAEAQRVLDAWAEEKGLERCCLRCGCTDAWGCDEGCLWVRPGLCSQCSGPEGDPA